MTDRELLERAAKAAGLIPNSFLGNVDYMDGLLSGARPWNPLADDGDALRLAVLLFLWEAVRDGYQHIDSDNDFYAATRRAIVRAAAAMSDAK